MFFINNPISKEHKAKPNQLWASKIRVRPLDEREFGFMPSEIFERQINSFDF